MSGQPDLVAQRPARSPNGRTSSGPLGPSERLTATGRSLPGQASGASFTAELAEVAITDVLQTLARTGRDAVATIEHDGQVSCVWCQGGQVIDAQCAPLTGLEAIYRILSLETGSVQVAFRRSARLPTIDLPLEALLLTYAQRHDEASRSGLGARSQVAPRPRRGADGPMSRRAEPLPTPSGPPPVARSVSRSPGGRGPGAVATAARSAFTSQVPSPPEPDVAVSSPSTRPGVGVASASGAAPARAAVSGPAPRVVAQHTSRPSGRAYPLAIAELEPDAEPGVQMLQIREEPSPAAPAANARRARRPGRLRGLPAAGLLGVGLLAVAAAGWALFGLGGTAGPSDGAAASLPAVEVAAPGATAQPEPGSPGGKPVPAGGAVVGQVFAVNVQVVPASARVLLDGQALGTGKVVLELPVDGRTHDLRLAAPGYLPQTFRFRDAPVTERFVLEPAPVAEARAATQTNATDEGAATRDGTAGGSTTSAAAVASPAGVGTHAVGEAKPAVVTRAPRPRSTRRWRASARTAKPAAAAQEAAASTAGSQKSAKPAAAEPATRAAPEPAPVAPADPAPAVPAAPVAQPRVQIIE